MRKIKRYNAYIISSICTLLVWTNAISQYTLTDDDVVVIDGIIESFSFHSIGSTNILIPDVLDGQTVVGIANKDIFDYGVFGNKGIVSLKLPATIEFIGDRAFEFNNISNLDISNCSSLYYLGKNCFNENQLQSIDLSVCPAIRIVEEFAFNNNPLEKIGLPENIEYGVYGWKDINGLTYNAGDSVSDLALLYYIPAPYTLTDDDVEVVDGLIQTCSYDFEFRDIIIPDMLDGQIVIGVVGSDYPGIFYNKRITSITFPSTTELIGEESFRYNIITTVNLDGCTSLINIGESAFEDNRITAIDFSDCIALEHIEAVAFGSNKLTELDLSPCLSLINIGAGAFIGNDILNLNLSGCSSLTSIEGDAFSRNNMENVNFSGCTALQTIGTYAFQRNSLTNLDLSECSALTTIEGYAFQVNDLENLDLSNCDALSYIGRSAFYFNELTDVNFNGCTDLTYIGMTAFRYNNLIEIDLSPCTALLEIDEEAFIENTLNSFVLPVNTEYDIYGWKDINGVTYNSNDIVSDLTTFYYVPVPYTLTDDDVVVVDGIIQSCSYEYEFRDIIIPDYLDGQTVTGIADKMDWDYGVFFARDIRSIDLPETIVRIGSSAFFSNYLTNLDLSQCSALRSIGSYAFSHNDYLSGINFTGCIALDTIENDAFWYSSLDTLDLSSCSSLSLISGNAFSDNSLTGVNLNGCTSLVSINFSAFEDNDITNIDFSGCTKLASIGNSAFYRNDLGTIDFTPCTELTYIGYSAFQSNDLTNLTLPVPDIDSMYFQHWEDADGEIFEGGQNVSKFNTSYTAILSTAYGVIFTVTDGIDPVQDALVSLSGYETVSTDITGKASFKKVALEENISYFVTASGFYDATGTIFITDSNVYEDVVMSINTGFSEPTEDQFLLYPNPVDDILSILLPEKAQIRIVDQVGRTILLKTEDRGKVEISVSDLKPGIYLISLKSKERFEIKKIMIE